MASKTFAGQVAISDLPPHWGLLVNMAFFPVEGPESPPPLNGFPPDAEITDLVELHTALDDKNESLETTCNIPFSIEREAGYFYLQVRVFLFQKKRGHSMGQAEPFFFGREPFNLLDDLPSETLDIQWPWSPFIRTTPYEQPALIDEASKAGSKKRNTAIAAAKEYAAQWNIPWRDVFEAGHRTTWWRFFAITEFTFGIENDEGMGEVIVSCPSTISQFIYFPNDPNQFMLPLWVAYPQFCDRAIEGDLDFCQFYAGDWRTWYNRLSTERQAEYQSQFPLPAELKDWGRDFYDW